MNSSKNLKFIFVLDESHGNKKSFKLITFDGILERIEFIYLEMK